MKKLMTHFLVAVFALFLMFNFSLSSASAQEGDEKDWEINITPYLFLSNLTGNATIGPISGPVNLKFSDLLKNLEIGGMLHSEVRKGRLGLITDVIYAKLGAATSLTQGATISTEVELLIFEALGFYRLPNTKGKVDVFAGIRYWYFDLDTSFILNQAPLKNSTTPDWVDPVIGIRTIQPLSPKWFAIIRTDIGGFGVSSSFSWQVQGGVGRKLGKSSSVFLGYKYLKTDYNNGITGPGAFAYDSAVHGVLLGFNFSFGPGAMGEN